MGRVRLIKDHRDYRTLYWTAEMDGPWSPAAVQRYVAGGYDGLLYQPPGGVRHRSLQFLLDLPGLRSLTVQCRVVDDCAVNEIDSLEHLVLITGSKVRLAVDGLPRLHSLMVNARPDMSAIGPLSALESLVVARWHGTDLAFLGPKPNLDRLRLDGRAARLRLDGIETSPRLTRLEVFDHQIATLSPLRGLTRMRHLLLSGPRRLPADNDLDLRDLSGMHQLHSLRLIAAGQLRSLHPVTALPFLRDLSLNEVIIQDGDLGPLFHLPSRTRLVPPTRLLDDPARYSHTLAELQPLG